MRIQLDPNKNNTYISIAVSDKKLPSLVNLCKVTSCPSTLLMYFRNTFRQLKQWDKADEIKKALEDFTVSDIPGGSIYVHKSYATTERHLEVCKKWIQES